MDIWKSENWKVFYSDKKVRTGLHTRFDTQIPPEINGRVICFANGRGIIMNFQFVLRYISRPLTQCVLCPENKSAGNAVNRITV